MTIPFQPLHDRILVKRVEQQEKTTGGILLPDTAKEKPLQGEVLAVGRGAVRDDGTIRPLEVKVGDRILFGKYGGTDVKLQGNEYVILRETDVMGVIG
ncbi:10 kDa chaperonin 5 [Candidatus Magnetaquicoccaceae bacterium FCR-1]|uniref:Co-chaperonin GroES n=1 Tax=Candidatus Magnetaquiglobus chichijimensis TaxID=3141448 RepID=A0ABQ0C874_9PROT